MKRREVLLAALGLSVLWQIISAVVDRPILPSPLEVAYVLVSELFDGELSVHALASLWRVVAGTLLSVLTAVPAGLAIGGSKN